MKKIAIGCDPNAADLKAVVMQQLSDLGYEYEDYGSEDPIYANVAIKVAPAATASSMISAMNTEQCWPREIPESAPRAS